MIEFMDGSDGNIVAARFTGKLSEADYSQVLIPRIASVVRTFGSARALIFMDENFAGWDLPAAWANTKLDVQFRHSLTKVAVVGAPHWEEWCVRLARLMFSGELRTFHSDQLAQAWDWLRA